LTIPDLKHGIFSYYLMKGLEGEADESKDRTITVGKLQSYVALCHDQEPQAGAATDWRCQQSFDGTLISVTSRLKHLEPVSPVA